MIFCHRSNAQATWDIARCQCSSTSPSQNAVNGCYFVLFLEATHPKTYPGPPVFPKFFEASKTDLTKSMLQKITFANGQESCVMSDGHPRRQFFK